MKKLVLILPVVALAACNQQKTLVSGCEKIVTNELGGDIYKCPMTEELAAIQAMDANSMFGSIENFDIGNAIADTEHVYVNIYGQCAEQGQVAYRVIVKNPVIDGESMYSVEVCR